MQQEASIPTTEKPQNGTHFVPPTELQFLDLLSLGVPVVDACERSGMARRTAYHRRNTDEAFRQLCDEALQMAGDLLEEEADRRGRHGWEENVWHKGRIVGSRRCFSDRMLMFRLKALKPARYGKPA